MEAVYSICYISTNKLQIFLLDMQYHKHLNSSFKSFKYHLFQVGKDLSQSCIQRI